MGRTFAVDTIEYYMIFTAPDTTDVIKVNRIRWAEHV